MERNLVPSVCFATPMVRPLVDPDFPGDFGGAEVRAWQFARGLAARKTWEVSMVLHAHGRQQPMSFGNVRAWFESQPAPIAKSAEIPRSWARPWQLGRIAWKKGCRSVHKRWERWQTLRPRALPAVARAPGEVVCVFGVHHYAAHVVETARRQGRMSVLFLASDTDLDPRYQCASKDTNDYGQSIFMCRFALQHADQIVAQTEQQAEQLWERFRRHALVVRNPIDLTPKASQQPPADVPYALWVGRADTFSKRADLCWEIAERCAPYRFVAVLNKRQQQVFDDLVAAAPANVQIVERVPFEQMDGYFEHARLFLNTSMAEGFPNAFLQAGKFGVPVASLHVDPDRMLTRHGCGSCADGDIVQLSRQVKSFFDQTDIHAEHSARIQQYVRQRHELTARVQQLAAAVEGWLSPITRKAV